MRYLVLICLLVVPVLANPLEILEIEPPLFGLQSLAFEENGSSLAIQQEYIFKHLKEYPAQYGLLLANLQNYTDTFSAQESLENTESLTYKSIRNYLDRLPVQDRRVIQAYYTLKNLNNLAGDTPYFRKLHREAMQEETSGWTRLLVAMAYQTLLQEKLNPELQSEDLETLLKQTSLKPTNDAFLHYSLGNFYNHILKDSESPYRRMRMVTLEYERARSMDPRNRQLFTRITSKYITMQQEYEAQDLALPFEFEELVYRRILLLDPRNPSAHNNLAWLYCQNSTEVRNAIRHAKIATEISPEEPSFLDTLGWCLYRGGMVSDAIRVLETAREKDSQIADVHFHLATAYYDENRIDDSIEAFKRTIELEPDNALAMNNLAYTYAEFNRNIDEAYELIQRVLQMVPENSAFVDTLGWVHYRRKEYDLAIEALKKAIELSPDSWESHEHLAAVYKELNQSDQMETHLAIAARLKGLNPSEEVQTAVPTTRPAEEEVSSETNPQSAYTLLFQTIEEAKARYLSLKSADKSPASIKVFYDQLIGLAQTHGDAPAVHRLIQEFALYRKAFEPAAETTPQKTLEPIKDLKELIPSDALAYLELGQAKLVLLLQEFSRLHPVSGQMSIASILPQLKPLLPETTGIALLNLNQKPDYMIAARLQKEQSQILKQNLRGISGQSIVAPLTGLRVQISQKSEHQFAVHSAGQTLHVTILENALLCSTNPESYTGVTPENSLKSQSWVQSRLDLINQPDQIAFYTRDLKSLAGSFSGLALLKSGATANLISSMGEYLAILKLDGNVLNEHEFIEAAQGVSQTTLKGQLETYIQNLNTTFDEQKIKVEANLEPVGKGFELKTRLIDFQAFLNFMLKNFGQTP